MIVILGILAAVVVFAVGGITNTSKTSACKIEVRTINTATQAYYAQNNAYPDRRRPPGRGDLTLAARRANSAPAGLGTASSNFTPRPTTLDDRASTARPARSHMRCRLGRRSLSPLESGRPTTSEHAMTIIGVQRRFDRDLSEGGHPPRRHRPPDHAGFAGARARRRPARADQGRTGAAGRECAPR